MTIIEHISGGIAYDRAGPLGQPSVVLIHAGIADRRMWEPQFQELAATHDVVRLDLRGFGDSGQRPDGQLSHVDDVRALVAELGLGASHMVGASLGAGVAVEFALTYPDLVTSLLLSAPGGCLIAEVTPELEEFIAAEDAALECGDLDEAAEANVRWWVDGPRRATGSVDVKVRDSVRQMQRRAFELTIDWDDVDEAELDPPALDRLAEIQAPTLVVDGELDLDAIRDAARRVAGELPYARHVHWNDVAHLPSMERPRDFSTLLIEWLRQVED